MFYDPCNCRCREPKLISPAGNKVCIMIYLLIVPVQHVLNSFSSLSSVEALLEIPLAYMCYLFYYFVFKFSFKLKISM